MTQNETSQPAQGVMTVRTDDVLDQIDTALHDNTVSDDAMRSAPHAAPRPVGIPADARQLLIRRLVERHGLTRMTARHAVLAVEQGRTSQHAALVQDEARAAMEEMTQRLRAAFRPMVESMVATLKQLGEAFERLRASAAPAPAPGRRPDRPAWQSPYGPARRKH